MQLFKDYINSEVENVWVFGLKAPNQLRTTVVEKVLEKTWNVDVSIHSHFNHPFLYSILICPQY